MAGETGQENDQLLAYRDVPGTTEHKSTTEKVRRKSKANSKTQFHKTEQKGGLGNIRRETDATAEVQVGTIDHEVTIWDIPGSQIGITESTLCISKSRDSGWSRKIESKRSKDGLVNLLRNGLVR